MGPSLSQAHSDPLWWRDAVIYQVYPRSFADGNGDGIGDLAGLRERLPYLARLGVDAIWVTPWYASPMADGGYDVADYRAIDPEFGTLEQAEQVIREARELGIRTIVDVVPNHVSSQHAWFIDAMAAAPGSPERARFWFHPGKGPSGQGIPTHWCNEFAGPSWTRTRNADGTPGEWYLHLFTPEQPDLNWSNPEVVAEHLDILRFWFDRGAAGIRIDSAALLVKDAALPELAAHPRPGEHPYVDRDELHDIYRGWRAVADEYPDTRMLVGEVWLEDRERFARYLRRDEMHTAFNFDFMARPWDARQLRDSIDQTLTAHAPVGAPPTWVLSNHDVTRPVTRYGREDTSFQFATKRFGTPTDLALGSRRARAAALLTAALPGCWYVYQGEELGLPEVEDLPLEVLQDPMHYRSGGTDPGRDGCRVPLPWSEQAAPYGFSPEGATHKPWLPQPADWADLTVEAEEADEASMLHLYRRAVRVRKAESGLGDGPLDWVDAGPEALAFARGDVLCVVNLGPEPVDLPPHEDVLLLSDPLDAGRLPRDTAVWLRTTRTSKNTERNPEPGTTTEE
jgi:alpha-glucosidase